jgi:CO/xanthine dehydrogenase FAD-binding subunit
LLGLDNKAYGEIRLTKGNGIEADPDTFTTSVDGVFAGGDVVTGPATAVEAIAAGRKAARTIAAKLSGKKLETAGVEAAKETLRGINGDALKTSERVTVAEVAPAKRSMECEDYVTLDDGKVSIEAHRCLDCSCVAVNASDVAPALIALGASIKTTKRTIAAEDFFTVGLMSTTVLAVDELVKEIRIPAPKPGTRFSFQKFRIRNSIDFPIVSVASALSYDGATIKDARVVFGAVAPIPLRAVHVEEALVGKKASEETAEIAGAVAAKQVFPLECNRYKVQILKGLLRKAIVGGS